MEARRFEKQPGLLKMHKVATVLMWISWVLVFFTMLAMENYFLPDGRMLLFMLYILAVAAVEGLLSFSLFSWISFKLKTVNETGWQLLLTGGFLITYLLLSMRLFY
ncbi:hypothetical protein NQ540_01580 [Granulicatella adiacens ATCC 49175]|uniref:Uncharacterized protein n=1 Tax=Granulicatella adiacens ATCC 49175 TaxID=638301 RepID=C8NH53_9LACT|nr:hypothetical protein [Granulicatella adiacens]EEW37030.1 hypothetical protein HMPREF0444_1248 [Granulicatella adiacens ATCC 49175]UAK94321.1 hypothetical protein K8O88_03295 [Granulicatella adiacens]UWP38438.1 hypothetical protein NQ540_01580 [Granulicatella adiacens ATCC 49175]